MIKPRDRLIPKIRFITIEYLNALQRLDLCIALTAAELETKGQRPVWPSRECDTRHDALDHPESRPTVEDVEQESPFPLQNQRRHCRKNLIEPGSKVGSSGDS